MAKYYIKCGTLELIYSTNKDALGAAIDTIWETNDNDTLDEHFYIDERGFRDYTSADNETKVLRTERVMQKAGWIVE
jgi:hypothetical protein